MRRGCSHRIGGLLAGVAESVDAEDLKSSAFGRAGSSPASGTTSGACPAPRTAREGRRASFDSMRSRPSSALRFHGMNFPLSGSTPALVSCGSFSLSRPDYLWHYLVIFSRISWVILSFSLVSSSSSPQSSLSGAIAVPIYRQADELTGIFKVACPLARPIAALSTESSRAFRPAASFGTPESFPKAQQPYPCHTSKKKPTQGVKDQV